MTRVGTNGLIELADEAIGIPLNSRRVIRSLPSTPPGNLHHHTADREPLNVATQPSMASSPGTQTQAQAIGTMDLGRKASGRIRDTNPRRKRGTTQRLASASVGMVSATARLNRPVAATRVINREDRCPERRNCFLIGRRGLIQRLDGSHGQWRSHGHWRNRVILGRRRSIAGQDRLSQCRLP
jgi:hypothetical protein